MNLRIVYPSLLALIFLVVLSVNLVFYSSYYRSDNNIAKIVIKRGDNLRSVSVKLQNNGVIFDKYVFILTGKIFGYEDNIIPGEYEFSNGLTIMDVFKMITDSELNRGVVITIPEGLNIRQIARILSRQLSVDSALFVKEAANDSLIKLLGIDEKNLEGFLFPDTYQFSFKKTGLEKEIVLTMFNQFRRKIDKKLLDNINQKKLSLKNVIIMASIIEGETRFIPEMKTISGVYYNRLKKKMRLEADPTVQYALPDGPKKRLSYSDLKVISPYNTYLNSGLPPGPINCPGLNAILAAVNPESHNYLYFVAKGDGSHKYASTYDEHKKNILEYRKFLDEQNKVP